MFGCGFGFRLRQGSGVFLALPLCPLSFSTPPSRSICFLGRSWWWVIRKGFSRGPVYVCNVAWPSLCLCFFSSCPFPLLPVVPPVCFGLFLAWFVFPLCCSFFLVFCSFLLPASCFVLACLLLCSCRSALLSGWPLYRYLGSLMSPPPSLSLLVAPLLPW